MRTIAPGGADRGKHPRAPALGYRAPAPASEHRTLDAVRRQLGQHLGTRLRAKASAARERARAARDLSWQRCRGAVVLDRPRVLFAGSLVRVCFALWR